MSFFTTVARGAIVRCLAIFLCSGALHSPAGAQTAWKMATGYPEKFFHTENIQLFAMDVAAATQGTLKITVHPAGSLFKLNEIKDAVQAGNADIGEVLFASMVKEMPLTGVDSVPFVVGGYEDARRLWKFHRPKSEQELAAKGLTLLFSVPWPPQALYTLRPVKRSGDMKGMNVRAQNQTIVRIAQYWGATPVTDVLTPGDVGKALSEGRINALITSSVTGVEGKAWEHLRYVYKINAWIPRNVVLANAKAFAALDAATREAVLKAAAAAEERGWRLSSEANEHALSELGRNGMKVEQTPLEFEQDLARLGERFTREWIKQAGHSANDIFIPYYSAR
jgi:TRAP-type C4-dicarboxylate transport system substrate-binding protein